MEEDELHEVDVTVPAKKKPRGYSRLLLLLVLIDVFLGHVPTNSKGSTSAAAQSNKNGASVQCLMRT